MLFQSLPLFLLTNLALRSQAVVEALRTNEFLTDIKAEDFDPTEKKAWFKLVQDVSESAQDLACL